MQTGCRGAFVVPWSRTEVDGLRRAPVDSLRAGASWVWTGGALRVDGPATILGLGDEIGAEDLRRVAGRAVRRILGGRARHVWEDFGPAPQDDVPGRQGVRLTDGQRVWSAALIAPDDGGATAAGDFLLVFYDALPPPGRTLWVVDALLPARHAVEDDPNGGLICFTPGTMIETPSGRRRVEALRPGDQVLTRDDGAQPLLWVGARDIGGARLRAYPDLRPIRIRAGAFGFGLPDADLIVSPQHRMLLRGRSAQALFAEAEVLARAADLVDGRRVGAWNDAPGARYCHLMFARHQIIVANGMESESFHPASAPLSALAEADRRALLALAPGIARDPEAYGPYARRLLTRPEALILRHAALAA